MPSNTTTNKNNITSKNFCPIWFNNTTSNHVILLTAGMHYSWTRGLFTSSLELSSPKYGDFLLQFCSCPFPRSMNTIAPNTAMPADMKKTICHCPLVGCQQKESNHKIMVGMLSTRLVTLMSEGSLRKSFHNITPSCFWLSAALRPICKQNN